VLLQKWKECRDGVDDACEVWLPEVQPWDGFSEDIANEEPYDAERLKRLDAAISRVMTNRADQPVVIQYRPGARWLWGQWRGTVLPSSKWYIAASMLAGILLDVTLNLSVWRLPTWPLFTVPDARHPVISRLIPLNSFWNQQVTLTTFILTFFLGHAYTYWRTSYQLSRSIQSRLQDTNLMLACHCFRDSSGDYTPAARQLLEACARNTRLLAILFWAAQDDSLSSLHSGRGLRRLVQRGVMSERESYILYNSGIPAEKRHNVVIAWIMTRTVDARFREVLEFGAGTESVFAANINSLRALCNKVSDEACVRMPLAYVHLVQLLVDTLLIIAPFALYPRLGIVSAPLCGLLTLFFHGLLELSKRFLDPFGNEGRDRDRTGATSQNVNTDTLVAEVNRASTSFWRSTWQLPFDTLQVEQARAAEANGFDSVDPQTSPIRTVIPTAA